MYCCQRISTHRDVSYPRLILVDEFIQEEKKFQNCLYKFLPL